MDISLIDFGTLITNFYEYMNRDKKPRNDRVKLWHENICGIKSSDIREAFEWMKDNLDSLPHNIPKALKAAVFNINRSKPESQALPFKKHRYGICKDCNGTGIFKTRVCFNSVWTEPIQYCSKCDNWKHWTNSPGDRVLKAELVALNVRFKPYNKVLMNSYPNSGTGSEKELIHISNNLGESKRLDNNI